MSRVFTNSATEARESDCKDLRLAAKPAFTVCWKALFPFKPAVELAVRTGCSVRTAEYQLSGEHHPSAQALAALINEIVPPWK